MEAVAYTWFNRIIAIRFMEVNDYLGHGHRVLSSATAGGLPDILAHAADLAASRELPGLDAAHIAELYRLLLVAQCNALSTAMPFLFERIDDETELQLPDDIARYLPTWRSCGFSAAWPKTAWRGWSRRRAPGRRCRPTSWRRRSERRRNANWGIGLKSNRACATGRTGFW